MSDKKTRFRKERMAAATAAAVAEARDLPGARVVIDSATGKVEIVFGDSVTVSGSAVDDEGERLDKLMRERMGAHG